MDNIKYKCLWCDFNSSQIKGLKYHVLKMHISKKYSNRVAGRLLKNYVSDIRINEKIIIAAISYSPKPASVNKENRKISNYIISEKLGYNVSFEPIHFA